MMIKATTKRKPHPMAGKLDELRIKMAENGGASVHTRHHPKAGMEHEMYQPEVESGSFSSPEEALHHAAKHMGVDVSMEDAAEEKAESPAVERAEKKGKAA